MKLIIPWYKLIAQAFKHQDLENVLSKGSSCTILKRRPFFFFFKSWNPWKKKLGLSKKVTRKFNAPSPNIYIVLKIFLFFFFFENFSLFFFFWKDLEILIFFFFCLFYFGNEQNETKTSMKMHQSWNLLTNKKL